jgi:hypothetical protein
MRYCIASEPEDEKLDCLAEDRLPQGEARLMAKKSKDSHHVRLYDYLLKTSAWLGLSAGARAIYIQIAFRYYGSNNGRIAYSCRDAARECNLARDTAHRAFKELVDAGFIEETLHGGLSRKTRIASEWRLTAHKCDLTGSLSSNLFMTRGVLVNENRKHRSRPQTSRANAVRLSQTTASETPEPVLNDGRECPKRRPVLSQTGASQSPECPKRRPVKAVFEPSPVLNDGTHLIYQGYAANDESASKPPEPSPNLAQGRRP